MDTSKTIKDVLTFCFQDRSDFKLDHEGGNLWVLKTGARRNTTFYPLGSSMTELAPCQTLFYRAMTSNDAYAWLEWFYCNQSMPFPLDRDDPLCLASFPGYSQKILKSNYVLIEFFAPGFASNVFDANRDAHKIFGLKPEDGDYSWGLSTSCQMSHDQHKCGQLIKDLPQLFKNAILSGGSFKVVAFRT